MDKIKILEEYIDKLSKEFYKNYDNKLRLTILEYKKDLEQLKLNSVSKSVKEVVWIEEAGNINPKALEQIGKRKSDFLIKEDKYD